ncbi:MAG: DUF1573 domain-containing protein [Flavobacteriales bacterium]|nr:DUF1573 domain-containing protein [Flavobacteriales bacterium]
MKSPLPILAIALLFSCGEEQQQVTPEMINFPKSASGESDKPLPQLKFENEVFEFAPVAEGEKLSHAYTFTNTGNAPLIISQVKPSCGCTTLKDWPTQPIQPGEGGQISIDFNSSGRAGKVDKSIFVQANTVPATTMLYLRGTVHGPGEKKDSSQNKGGNPIFAPSQ